MTLLDQLVPITFECGLPIFPEILWDNPHLPICLQKSGGWLGRA